METVVRFSSADWARSRFVRSRLWEAVTAVRVLVIPHMQAPHRPWLAALDLPAITRRVVVLAALNPASGWVPEFLAPPPRPATASLDDELDRIQTYPLEPMAVELQRSLDSRPTPRRVAVLAPLIADPAVARNQIVTELRSAWDLLIAPHWPRIDELVTADIAHRGAVIARAGLAAALDDLHADVHSEGDRLRLRGGDPIALDLAGAGLCLMPSAFVWPLALIVRDAGWPITLAYPARGVAAMWTEPPAPPDSLARLLGTTRAAILADLANARTTRQLGHRHQLAQATVSEHLAALTGAQLLTRRRDRREVRYQRSRLGDRLVRANTDATTQDLPV